MGIFRQFPYSNFHEMNMDEILKIVKTMSEEWEETKSEWASYKDFIDNYFANLDVSEEVLDALRIMANTGELSVIIDPKISSEVADWLNNHITPTTPAIDSSLTISGAGADAETVGKLLLRTFNTFQTDLYDSTDIAVGNYVQTLGYYNVGDGGRAIYQITDTADDYTLSLNHGLKAKPVFIETVNAGAYGAIGSGDILTRIRQAISYAEYLHANIIFPSDFRLGGGITFGSNFDNRIIEFKGNIIYSGTSMAITLHNTKNVIIKGNNLDASNGSGFSITQDGNYTAYNNNVFFNFITAKIAGVHLIANTWGIYENNIKVNRINCTNYGFRAQCIGSNEEHNSFIGQNTFDCRHIVSTDNYAIRLDASAENTTITGLYINNLSMEGSANGIMLRGDCKMIKIYNIRCLEDASFTWFINASGEFRFNEFNFTSPVMINKVTVSTTSPIQLMPIKITGGVYSPEKYRYADELICNSQGKFAKSYTNMIKENGTDFEYDVDHRCFTHFENNSGITINCDVSGYFNPVAHDTLYVTQNKTTDSILIIKRGSAIVFDGSAVTDEGEHKYMIQTSYNPSVGSNRYRVTKIS